jgi:uncharacterized protein GlcG (DUF336 family)
MTELTLDTAQTILAAALKHARGAKMKPLGVAVLDARGALKAYAAEDKSSLRRENIAHGKAYGALALGIGTRAIDARARERPHFMAAVSHVVGGALIPVPGGVLIKDSAGDVIGAVGVSGDTSDNDEAAAMAGIRTAGFTADPGAA